MGRNVKMSTDKIKPKTRAPKCSRCQYHGIPRDLKGHKRFCPFQDCLCEKCKLNVARREIMAAQLVQRRRELEQEMRHLQNENTRDGGKAFKKSFSSPVWVSSFNDVLSVVHCHHLYPDQTTSNTKFLSNLSFACQNQKQQKVLLLLNLWLAQYQIFIIRFFFLITISRSQCFFITWIIMGSAWKTCTVVH
jgi:hypothetical protein